jgi:ribosomal-protein-alanine N-acetyltransferase
MENHFRIRSAETPDAAAIWAVECRSFSDPWSLSGIGEMIESANTQTLVAESDGAVAGFLVARSVRAEGEILNLAVLPQHRRRGLGRELLTAGLDWLRKGGVREVYLEVRQSNAAALAMYQARGFRPVGVRPDYYRNPREDALVLRCLLEERQ